MSYAFDINDSGVVVGVGFVRPGDELVGVPVWWPDSSGGPQRLDHAMALGDLLGAEALRINDRGEILVRDMGRALLVDPAAGSVVEITAPFAVQPINLFEAGMNNEGDVVGLALVDVVVEAEGQYWVRHAFLWDSATREALDLGTLPGAESSAAYDINDAGQIIGESDGRPFVWDPDSGTVTELVGVDRAVRINNDGMVLCMVGGRAVVWDLATGQFSELAQGGPGTIDSAADFNDAGWIAGYAVGSCPNCQGFVWDPVTGKTIELIDGAGNPFAINELGQVVGTSNARAAIWNPSP